MFYITLILYSFIYDFFQSFDFLKIYYFQRCKIYDLIYHFSCMSYIHSFNNYASYI
jgi:hypothetical protein